jgi:uncharacterized protein (TIGR03435 family)
MNMTRTAVISALAVFLPAFALAQAAPARPEFEVASIRPAAPQDARVDIGMHIDGSQVRFNFLSVRDCMRIAWKVKDYQVVGPDWVGSDRFNITAKVPDGGANQDQVAIMLQNLIKDRFKLTYHMDKKDFAVYALVAAKGGMKLKETPPDDAADGATASKSNLNVTASGSAAGVSVSFGNGSYYNFGNNKLVGHKLSMEQIVETLSRYMDKPLIDMTGAPATAFYDFSFDITSDDYRVMLIRTALKAGVSLPPEAARLADMPIDSLYTAMEASGLKLDSRKAPLDVFIVDHADKTPTEN